MTLDIIIYGDPVLREKAAEVTITPELQQLADDMLETVRHNKAVGLAANQIGKALQLCVIEFEGKVLIMFNPTVTTFGKPATAYESCLSFPGVCARLRRPDGVKVSYLDREGQPQTLEATGVLARIIQHETDHLKGTLIRDFGNRFKRV